MDEEDDPDDGADAAEALDDEYGDDPVDDEDELACPKYG
jgi:hypothetical protein